MKLYLGLALLATTAARKAPKKFESAKEMTLDAPALEAKGDQLFCVAPPDEAALKLVFASITWDIDFKPDSRGRARAVSDDDFHETGRSIVGKLRKTLLDHWELAFVYMLFVAAASCWVVGVSRKSKNFHETVRVACRLGVPSFRGRVDGASVHTGRSGRSGPSPCRSCTTRSRPPRRSSSSTRSWSRSTRGRAS